MTPGYVLDKVYETTLRCCSRRSGMIPRSTMRTRATEAESPSTPVHLPQQWITGLNAMVTSKSRQTYHSVAVCSLLKQASQSSQHQLSSKSLNISKNNSSFVSVKMTLGLGSRPDVPVYVNPGKRVGCHADDYLHDFHVADPRDMHAVRNRKASSYDVAWSRDREMKRA